MGWTFTHKSSTTKIKDFFTEEFKMDNDKRSGKVLACSIVGWDQAYIAYESTEKKTGNKKVFAIICLLGRKDSDYFNFGYKDMDETEGPYYYRCPKKILEMLTEPESLYGLMWRLKCSKQFARPIKNPKLLPKGASTMFGISPLKPAYGRDYTNKKDLRKDFNDGKDFETSMGQHINKEQLKQLGINTIEVRYGKLMKVDMVPVN